MIATTSGIKLNNNELLFIIKGSRVEQMSSGGDRRCVVHTARNFKAEYLTHGPVKMQLLYAGAGNVQTVSGDLQLMKE